TPYTEEMLAIIFNRPVNTVRLALKTFKEFNMIEMDEKGLLVTNWEKHQNIAGLDKIREQTRLRVQKHRARQKALETGGPDDQYECVYCGKISKGTIDHIIPISRGGLDINENKVIACLECNMSKTNRMPDVYLNELMLRDDSFDTKRILDNKKIMQYVEFRNGKFIIKNSKIVVTQNVTLRNATDLDLERDLDLDKDLDKEVVPPDITSVEKEILNTLRLVTNYPFDYSKDLDTIRTLALDYPSVDMLAEIKKWRDYKRDKPLKPNSNVRLQIRNWMENAVKFAKRGGEISGQPQKPKDPAGKYRKFVS
ncbi:MAG: phage replisome organizer N-terminal domain-containing protein, partial [Dehalococcoidales bacterium]|nr:phage replisome organizer N-terminal domain-containing protein [Dehalococcoidales bacterium]